MLTMRWGSKAEEWNCADFFRDSISYLCRCDWVCNYQTQERKVKKMKGYTVEFGYMGYINGEYQLFADEQDYREAFGEE